MTRKLLYFFLMLLVFCLLVGCGARIVPGDPEASVLFAKVSGGSLAPDLGRPMPLHFERLTSEEIQILRDWISEGAKNN